VGVTAGSTIARELGVRSARLDSSQGVRPRVIRQALVCGLVIVALITDAPSAQPQTTPTVPVSTLRSDNKGCWDLVVDQANLIAATLCTNSSVSPPATALLHGGSFDNQGDPVQTYALYLRGIDDAGLTVELVRARITEAGVRSYRDNLTANTQRPSGETQSPQFWRAVALTNLDVGSGFEKPVLEKPERREFRLPRPPVAWRFDATSLVIRDRTVTVRFTAIGSSVTATIMP
jgi:hypothetical protein